MVFLKGNIELYFDSDLDFVFSMMFLGVLFVIL